MLGLIEEVMNCVEAKSAHPVSASGENCVRSFIASSPAGPDALGSSGNPDRSTAEEAGQTAAEAAISLCKAVNSEDEDPPSEKQ